LLNETPDSTDSTSSHSEPSGDDLAAIWQVPQTRQVLDSMTEMFVAIRRDYSIAFCNRVLREAAGPRHGELVGKNHWELWPDMRGTLVEDAYERAFTTGIPARFEFHYEPVNAWLDVSAHPHGSYLHVYFRDLTESKRLEAERANTEASLRAMIDSLPQIAWAASTERVPTYLNERWYEYTGLDRSEPYDAARVIHPDDLAPLLATATAGFEQGEAVEYEARLRRHDDEYRWHLIRIAPHRGPDGELLGYFGTSTDIHDRRKAEEAVSYQLRLTQAIANNADSALVMVDSGRRLTFVNEAFTRITGYAAEEAIGRRVHDVVHWKRPDGSPYPIEECPLEDMRRAIVAVRGHEDVFVRKDGSLFPVVVSISPLGGQGQDLGCVAEFRDVTAEKERAQALQESEQRYRFLADSVPVMVWTARPDGSVDFVNHRWRDYFRAPDDEIEGDAWIAVVHPEDRERVMTHWRRCLADQTPYALEYRLRRHDGVHRWHLCVAHPETVDGVLRAWVGGVVDVHAQRERSSELEREIGDRTAELVAANEAMEAFTYHVSHDLRAPLRAIVGTSHMIQDDYGREIPEEARRLLGRQADAATKLGQLIDDLLKLSRLSRTELEVQTIDFSALAREMAAEALATHPGTQVRVEVESEIEADADPRLLRLAVLNLIENAVKYSPDGGTVRVGRDSNGAYFVADEGIGISPDYFGKIFEPFQRLHRDDEFRGTGIGLSNVRQVVTRHGGRVWVESEPGRGSTFRFTLGNH